MSKFSNTLILLYLTRKGYRTEKYRGSRVRDIKSIIDFEINELENIDIIDTMQNLYTDFPIKEESEINNKSIEIICDFISKKLNTSLDNIESIWLTSKENVMKYYIDCNYNNDDIDEYNISHNFIPISDLDKEGVLFAYIKGGINHG